MSDIMRPIHFSGLMDWVLTEYEQSGSIFGVRKIVRYGKGRALPIFKEKTEAPYGPAAGPHTQLAQNIIAAYAAGARFFELKTVQTMDGEELSKCVAKPCIAAADECYNCEWSTELTVPQAYAEYVKAWFACKLLAAELRLGDPDGFVFNMSVGYDLAGIKSEKIDRYIEGMKDASSSDMWRECREWALGNVSRFKNADAQYIDGISPAVSSSITESTLHGCPPDEIERIATYLITEKGLNTYVKCNPTLLGYDFARAKLDSLGFDYVSFDEHHFKEDLQWADAVPMFRRLFALCRERGLEFGVKLTNTFPVEVRAGELPSSEMYMSGRALFPLTVTLAQRVAEEFDGGLRISYSGGADARNCRKLFDAGIWPITMATTILKPGGYQRFSQIGSILTDCGCGPFRKVDAAAVKKLAESTGDDAVYRKPAKPLPSRKLAEKVPLIDCFTAPCRGGCPIEQDIPAYLMAAGRGDWAGALEIITRRNALPFTTGTICPHHCADKCMRNYYEETVRIRDVKLRCARGGYDSLMASRKAPVHREGVNVAVVGGGPAGLSAAYFLTRAGADATVFDRRGEPGGIVRGVIPEFRIPDEAIGNDAALCLSYGAKFVPDTEVRSAAELFDRGFTHVIFATGAWMHGSAGLEYGGELDVLEFLEKAKRDPVALSLGTDVAVIGGGNTAMDAARAAKRLPGVEHVRLIYRRTKRYMPADEEELALAVEDGVEFMELLVPIGVRDGVLTCSVMELGAADASGRRSPVSTGRTISVPATAVISAVGERTDSALYAENGIASNKKGRPETDGNMRAVKNVYIIGDARRGPATVVEAIADAAAAANDILGGRAASSVDQNICPDYNIPCNKKGEICADCDLCGDSRCLGCATVCEVCADVCPNRANVAVSVPGKRERQIVHVDGMCNECGNCATFCPYDSRPYRDKFTLFWSREDFGASENEGWLPLDGENGKCLVRLSGGTGEYDVRDPGCGLPGDIRALILAVTDSYGYLVKRDV